MDTQRYCSQLRALADCSHGRKIEIPECLRGTSTPLKPDAWRRELLKHPDREFVEMILRGITEGFRIGYDASTAQLKQQTTNMLSALAHREVMSRYITQELQATRLVCVGSEEVACSMGIHCSPLGVIPKKNRPNKWRLITNLSAPEGYSVNDGIDKELSSVSYISVDNVVARILKLGRGALLAKMDIKQAYRNVPVSPEDRFLLGMCWEGKVYVDTALPFGLRSAPLIFTALAEALLWIMRQRGATNTDNYIDDFVTAGAPDSQECEHNSTIMHETCEEVGLPAEPEKDEGPATSISFLGIELDTVALEIRLPAEKLERLRTELGKWRGKKACRKRDLLSLIGVLSHACKAVKAGRSFLRRLIDLSTVAKHLDHFVRFSRDARSDVEWWYQFSTLWNGVSMMRAVGVSPMSATLTSDASGSWGCGAFCGPHWFMLQWSESYLACHISAKELVPIVIAAVIWGKDWGGKTIRVWCDNIAAVSAINLGTSRNQEAMHLVRCLAFIKAKLEFDLTAAHLPGVSNCRADALSRNHLSLFRTLHPQANQEPTAIPEALLDLLIISRPDWTSKHWTELWSSIFRTA